MDLAELSWIHFTAPKLGHMRLPLLSGDFLEWARKAEKLNGQAFVLSMLAALAQVGPDQTQVSLEMLGELADEDVDAIATLITEKAGRYFDPHYVVAGSGRRRTVRRRRDDEPFELDPIEGERSANRLLRSVKIWLADRADADELLLKRMSPTTDLLRMHDDVLGVSRILRDQTRLDEATRVALGGSLGLRSEALATSRLIPDYALGIRESVRVLGRRETVTALALAQSHRSVVAETLESIAGRRDLNAWAAGLSTYPYLAAHTRSVVEAAVRGLSLTNPYGAPVHRNALARSVGIWDSESLADQFSFAKTINREFDLGLSRSALAATRALTDISDVAGGVRSAFPPGYQLAATLGLRSALVRGLTADILRNYGVASDEAPMFAIAAGGTTLADDPDFSSEAGAAYLADAAVRLVDLSKSERDPVKLGAILTVLTFILTLIGAVSGIGSLYYGREQVILAREAAEPSDSDRLLAQALEQVSESQRDLAANQRELLERERRVRYVHDRSVLRLEPHGGAPSIRLIYPDQLLRVIEERGDWLMVDVYDYQSDTPVRGWVSRRRVRLSPLE